jgi:hypothetical protein
MTTEDQGFSRSEYVDSIDGALERLSSFGPIWHGGLAFHGPMAVEAMASLGYYGEIPHWVERDAAHRQYELRTAPAQTLDAADPSDWRAALGDPRRHADWAALFGRELVDHPWPEVVVKWWPVLSPGMFGALGHGLIRTAHAVRALRISSEPTVLQLDELSQGLGFWASAFSPSPVPGAGTVLAAPAARTPEPAQVAAALAEVAATTSGLLADRAPVPAIPLVHAVTIPAAIELVLPILPPDLQTRSYHDAIDAAGRVLSIFSRQFRSGPVLPAGVNPPALEQSVALAVESGDDHAIKLAEVVTRRAAGGTLVPEDPYLRAIATFNYLQSHGQAAPGGL